MGEDCLTIKGAWQVYDQWLLDPRVEIRREPVEVDDLFRRATAAFSSESAPKALGDCYLVALGQALNAIVVTLDRGLSKQAIRLKHEVKLLR